MSHIDQQVNRLLLELRASGAGENTVICFVSDHGEMLGDHHLWRKAFPYEGSARIPFALSGPGIAPGLVDTEHVVELRDVVPTLLEAAGIPVPDGVDGCSVLSLLREGNAPWRDYLHGEHTHRGQSLQYLTDGREKYVWMSGTGIEQLFDLEDDPHELHDRAWDADAAQRLQLWRGRLVAALADRPEGFVENGSLVTGRRVNAVLPFLQERLLGAGAPR